MLVKMNTKFHEMNYDVVYVLVYRFRVSVHELIYPLIRMMEQSLCKSFQQCSIQQPISFCVSLENAHKHIPYERLKILNRLARFQPYGYTTID